MSRLLHQLGQIDEVWREGATFSAYLLTSDQRKYYGLSLADLAEPFPPWSSQLSSLTAVASQASGHVVRINVQFFPDPTPHRVRYLIATGEARRDYAIRQVLTGEAAPTLSRVAPRLAMHEVLPPALRLRPEAYASGVPLSFSRPTFTLHDHFYARRDVSADQLVDLCNLLSQRYFQQADFHLRLETIDGDFHLHLDRRELRYLFERQRSKLLILYLDSRDKAAQWLTLRLIYHPLFTGPNAEVSLISPQADEVLDCLQETLGQETAAALLPTRDWYLGQSLNATPDLDTLIGAVTSLSREWLSNIPAVAWVSLTDGRKLPGLSLYQLAQRLAGDIDQVLTLAFFVTRISTGQVLTLWLARETAAHPFRVLMGLMWGEPALRQPIARWWQAQTWLTLGGSPQPTPANGRVALLAAQPDVGPDLYQRLATLAEDAHLQPQPMHADRAHQFWEVAAAALHDCGQMWVDMSYKQPATMFLTELAQHLGREVRLIMKADHAMPPMANPLSPLRYRDWQQDYAWLLAQLGK
jgi:hypothetical protein